MAQALPIDPTADDHKTITLPTDTPPSVTAMSSGDKDSWFDIGDMEAKLDEYQGKAEDLAELHGKWLTAYTTWIARQDRIYGKAAFIQGKVEIVLGNKPIDDFEPVELFNLGVLATATITSVTGLFGLITSIKTYSNLAETATRLQRFTAGGSVALSVITLGLGAYIAFRNVHERRKFLDGSLSDYDTWFTETTSQINDMKCILEEELLPNLREIARSVEVPVDEDDNVTFRALIAKLNETMSDAAEVEAQYRVATRMLCNGFDQATVVSATGLSATRVSSLADDIEDDSSICTPYLPAAT